MKNVSAFPRAFHTPLASPKAADRSPHFECKQAEDRAFGMLDRRFPDQRLDPQPVSYVINFSEGHTDLTHPKGSRVHPERKDLPGPLTILAL